MYLENRWGIHPHSGTELHSVIRKNCISTSFLNFLQSLFLDDARCGQDEVLHALEGRALQFDHTVHGHAVDAQVVAQFCLAVQTCHVGIRHPPSECPRVFGPKVQLDTGHPRLTGQERDISCPKISNFITTSGQNFRYKNHIFHSAISFLPLPPPSLSLSPTHTQNGARPNSMTTNKDRCKKNKITKIMFKHTFIGTMLKKVK